MGLRGWRGLILTGVGHGIGQPDKRIDQRRVQKKFEDR